MIYPPNDADELAKWLEEHNACEDARDWQKGKDLITTWETCECGDWLRWLLNECSYIWAASAWTEYRHAKAQAKAAYQRGEVQEWDECQRWEVNAIRSIIGNPFKGGAEK